MTPPSKRGRPGLVPPEIIDAVRDQVDAQKKGRWLMFEQFSFEECRSIRRVLDREGYDTAVVQKTTLLLRRP